MQNATSPRAESSIAAYPDRIDAQPASRRKWSRKETAERLVALDKARDAGGSERGYAEESATPRSTLRHWDRRRDALDLAPAVAQFFESPEGVDWLHRLVVSLTFVMTLRSPDGIRLVCEILELSGLADVVAPSLGSVQAMATRMQKEVIAFDREQRAAMAARMAPKKVSVCEDETFHPQTCLVAIEPVSNFILLEKYADRRDADTWTKEMNEAIAGLPVEIVQATTDEAKALKSHAREALEAHHSPDLFHGQYTVSRAISRPLGLLVEQAKERLEAAVLSTEQAKADRATYEGAAHGAGRPPNFDKRIMLAEAAEAESRRAFEEIEAEREAARSAITGISASYHAYRLSDGAPESPEAVAQKLSAQFDALEAIANKAGLSDRCHAGIDKARRLVPSMVATIAFVHTETASCLAALGLPDNLRTLVAQRLVPGQYLERVADRSSTAEERHRLKATAGALLSPLHEPGSAFEVLPDDRRAAIEATALGCADLFQRSSSCVEGRNGQLSLFHHGQHRLSPDKLAGLTAVHNYFVRRPDGTTAAERFFGTPPADLFEHLVTRMPHPSRPARKRRERPSRSMIDWPRGHVG